MASQQLIRRGKMTFTKVCNFVFVSVLIFISSTFSVFGDGCQNPTVKTNAYTTTDGMVITNVAYVAEFSVSCMGSTGKAMTLYADINGKTVPTMKSLDNSKYQVSWTEEVGKARSGDFPVKIYDDEGFSALRKAQRVGEDASTIAPVFTVYVNHGGTYQGPYVQSEFVAVFASILLWYIAYSTKSGLQS